MLVLYQYHINHFRTSQTDDDIHFSAISKQINKHFSGQAYELYHTSIDKHMSCISAIGAHMSCNPGFIPYLPIIINRFRGTSPIFP